MNEKQNKTKGKEKKGKGIRPKKKFSVIQF